MEDYNIIQIVSLVLNFILAGGITILLTMRSSVEKAHLEVKGVKHETAKKRHEVKAAEHEATKLEIDLLVDLKKVNDMLSTEIRVISERLIKVEGQNRQLLIKVEQLTSENESLKQQVCELSEMLSNVKTITRRA